MRYLPGHPLAGKTGLVSEARAVVYERLGGGKHPCHWCGDPVVWRQGARGNVAGSLIVDHLNADPLDDRPENLVQSCARCNTARGQAHRAVADDEPYVTDSSGHRHRAAERSCERCGEPFLIARANLRPGKGRFCSRSCARSKS